MRQELDEYYEYIVASRMSPGTLIQYKNILERLYVYLFWVGIRSWTVVTAEVLSKYKIKLSKNPGKSELSLIKESTQLQHWACIRSFFRYLREIKDIDNKSASIVFSDLRLKEELKDDFLSPEELHQLWSICEKNKLYLAIVTVMFFTGLRHSELIGCDLTAVSFEKEQIRVRGKGGKWRTVFLTPSCINILRDYLVWREGVVIPGENALFVTSRGRRINYDQLSYIFRKLKKYIPRIRPHLLRHTFATYLLETGSTIKEVQQQLGHKRLETTSRYTHATKEIKDKHHRLSRFMEQ